MGQGVEDAKAVSDRLVLLNQALQLRIVDWQEVQLYYHSLPLELLDKPNLQTCFCLLQIELTLYALSTEFKPLPSSERLLLAFLSNNSASFRNFDWLAFHYLRLLSLQTQKQSHLLPLHQLEQYKAYEGSP